MSYYEAVFIARQDISAQQADGLTENFQKIIEDQGGKVTKSENWGLRTLAYRIKKNRKGHYILMNIDGPAVCVHEMERQMHIHEDVLRCLTIRVDELEEGPSVITRFRDRDDRPRRSDRDRDQAPRGRKPENDNAASKAEPAPKAQEPAPKAQEPAPEVAESAPKSADEKKGESA